MRERSIGVMALIALLAFFAVAGTIFAYYFIPNPDLLAARDQQDTRSRKLVQVPLGDVELIVPGNLIARMKRRPLTGVRTLDLQVPWPYDPESEIAPPEEREDRNNQIFLTFMPTESETSEAERFAGIYEPYIARAPLDPIPGLKRYVFSTASPYADIEYYLGTSGKDPLYLKCELTPSSLGPRLCSQTFRISDLISLRYRFASENLKDWQHIHRLVRVLAARFVHKTGAGQSG